MWKYNWPYGGEKWRMECGNKLSPEIYKMLKLGNAGCHSLKWNVFHRLLILNALFIAGGAALELAGRRYSWWWWDDWDGHWCLKIPAQTGWGWLLSVLTMLKGRVSFKHPLLYTESLQLPGRPFSLSQFLYVAVIKQSDEKQLERVEDLFVLYFQIIVHLLKELRAGNQVGSKSNKNHGGAWLASDSIPCLCLATLHIQAKPSVQRMMLPTVGWVFLLQLIIIGNPSQTACRSMGSEQSFNCDSPLK